MMRAATVLSLLLIAAPAAAEQQTPPQTPPPPPKTVAEIVREKLQKMGKEPVRDTLPPDSARADSIRRARAQANQGANRAQSQAMPDMAPDSMMRALLRLEGYTSTQYKGLSARFNADTGMLVLTAKADQKAVVVQTGQTLVADSLLTFSRDSSVACGYGKPVLTGAGAEAPVESQLVCYNTRTRIGVAFGATTRMTQGASWIVAADLVTRGPDVYGRHARFTDCNLDYEHVHYYFRAGELKVVNHDVLVARNVTMNIGDVPVFWLPFMMQSLKQGRRSGILMPRFSVNDIVRRNSRYNRRIENVGFYWAASENMGAELTMDWFANNWTAVNGSLDYKFNDKFLDGRLTYRQFWKTEGGREFTLATGNSWQPNERTGLRADLQYTTSSSFIRDRSYDPRELNRSIDSNAGMQRRFDWGSLSLQASRRQYLTDNKVDLTLPRAGLSLSSITLFPASGNERFYNNATWTGNTQVSFTSAAIDQTLQPRVADQQAVTANASSSITMNKFSWSQGFDLNETLQKELPASGDTIDSSPEVKKRTVNWNTSLNFTQNLIGTTTFTPAVSMRGQFARDSVGKMIAAPTRMDLSANLKVDLFGFFPGIGPLERIRHRLSPTFSYSFSPKASPDSIQARLFGASETREQNRLSIGLSQTIEGKRRAPETEPADSVAPDTTTSDPDQPRRSPQARPITLLSLNTNAVVYDFVEARTGDGIQTTEISNSINSDLLQGLQLSITHDLFEQRTPAGGTPGLPGATPERTFSPRLTRVSASFSMTGSSWLFRTIGLAARGGDDTPAATGSTPTPVPQAATAGPPTDPSAQELGLLGTRNRPDEVQQQRPRGAIGSWNASLNYTLYRPRESPTGGASEDNQMVTANVTFQPTEMWSVAWNTGYSFSETGFTDHVLTLTRQMHDWDANFDFVKAQNGNFSFQFRVQLRANPDIKFDYQQRDNSRRPAGF